MARIISAEEAARRSGIPVEQLRSIRDGINTMLNDRELRARVDAQFFSGRLAVESGFDWYMDHYISDPNVK